MAHLHYHSAVRYLHKQLREKQHNNYQPIELITYWDYKTKKKDKDPFEEISKLVDARPSMMLDSGAHSAYMQRQSIDIHEFLRWQKELEQKVPKLTFRVGLDVIDDPVKNKEYCKIMKDAGVDLFPTFHPGSDPFDFLEYLLDEGFPLIGIGGTAQGNQHFKQEFFDPIFARLCRGGTPPIVKTHLFGVCDMGCLSRYPATTSDSTIGTACASYGWVCLPRFGSSGEINWTKSMLKVNFSTKNPRKLEHNQHLDTFLPGLRDLVTKYITDKGFTVEGLATSCYERGYWNMQAFDEQMLCMPEVKTFVLDKEEELFSFK